MLTQVCRGLVYRHRHGFLYTWQGYSKISLGILENQRLEGKNNLEKMKQDIAYGKCSQISNTFFFLSSLMWVPRLEFTKCLSESQAGKTLIRLLLKKQSDLGLHCMFIGLSGRQLVFKILEHLPYTLFDSTCSYKGPLNTEIVHTVLTSDFQSLLKK